MKTSTAEPFIAAVRGVFSQMFGLEATASPERTGDGTEDHEWGVSGILGLAGAAQGIVAIRLPLDMVDALLKASGVEYSSEQDRAATAAGLVGEIINIIAGNAITAFPDLDLDISPPVVVKGQNHQISWPKIAPVMAVRFSTTAGDFELGLCFNA
ncbi:MAG: chemotaxis protein CheX [Spirochaetales bacterium]|nr:MAG: chemotaxis protein CheX [Spirochaetales bacterium]